MNRRKFISAIAAAVGAIALQVSAPIAWLGKKRISWAKINEEWGFLFAGQMTFTHFIETDCDGREWLKFKIQHARQWNNKRCLTVPHDEYLE